MHPTLRTLLLDADHLVRAVASGRRGEAPPWRRIEVRYVDLKAGRRLQVTSYDETQAHTSNHDDVEAQVDRLLGLSFSHWHVQTTSEQHQFRVTKKGRVLHHVETAERAPARDHDRAKPRLLDPRHPVLRELGISDEQGRVKPSRQAKYRQVEEFLRALRSTLDDGWRSGALRAPTTDEPLRIVDLGCGNAYLTFVAQAWLDSENIPAHLTGVDVKDQSRSHNQQVRDRLGLTDRMDFVVGTITDADVPSPDVVLALHACDTATDDALARAVRWQAGVVLAAPCCHHDVAAQLRTATVPDAHAPLVRDGILRERLADTLTDALRASLLRAEGYRVEVVEFVASKHTPRNTLLRAVRTGRASGRQEYDALVQAWQVRPALGQLLGASTGSSSASHAVAPIAE